jgi:hypothetical protein
MFDLTLSFDNGPDPEVTPRVLDILRARSLRSTFFVLGRKLGDPVGQDLARRIRAEGHGIANHTFTHTVPLGENRRDRPAAGGDRHPDPPVPPLRRRRQSGSQAAQTVGGRSSGRRAIFLCAVEFDSAGLGGPGGLGRDRP